MPLGILIGSVLWVALFLGVAYQLLRSGKDPVTQFFWLFFFLFAPPVALVAYLLTSINYNRPVVRERLHGRSVARLRRDVPESVQEALFSDRNLGQVSEACRPLARLLRACGEGNKVYAHNAFELITSGARKRELLLEDIRQARKYIHIEYFRFGNDEAGQEVKAALLAKVKEGVEVRFLNNNMIGRKIPRSYFRDMQRQGMEVIPYTHIRHGWRAFLMRINRQNHRKIVIIDGRVAYTGGMNINNHYFYEWRDSHLRIEGPVVARLQASFVESWLCCGGRFCHPMPYYFDIPSGTGTGPFKDKLMQVVTDAAEFPWRSTQLGYEWILQNAHDYVYIQTPYFIPPDSLLMSLKAAALRGVDVRIAVPRNVDTPLAGPANRAYYQECLEAGIRLYERDGAFNHSKTLVCDDQISIVGSSNLDVRSFSLNNEVNTFIYDRETALHCKEVFFRQPEELEELHLQQWIDQRPCCEDLLSRIIRLLYHLL